MFVPPEELEPKPKNARTEWKGQEADWAYLMKALPHGALARGIDQAAKRSMESNRARLRRGCLPGTPDFYIYYNGITLWLERKKPGGGRFGPGQEAFRDAVRANGGFWGLVVTTEDVEVACLEAGIPLRATLGDIRARIADQNARLPAKKKRAPRYRGKQSTVSVAQARRMGIWK